MSKRDIEILKAKLKELEEKYKALEKKLQQKSVNRQRLEGLKVFIPRTKAEKLLSMNTSMLNPNTLQGQVVFGVMELIQKKKDNVSSAEILNYLELKQVDLGDNPPAMLAAILAQEVNKKSGSLVRVARGLYGLKHTEQKEQPANG